MMQCLSSLVLKDADIPEQWVLVEPLVWRLDDDSLFIVPEGTTTDLASIPRVFQNVLSVTGKSRKAAVLHDYLYVAQVFTRARSDELLRLALVAEGMNPITARVYWLGVRTGGWIPWGKRKTTSGLS